MADMEGKDYGMFTMITKGGIIAARGAQIHKSLPEEAEVAASRLEESRGARE
jgi:hypothetical protein